MGTRMLKKPWGLVPLMAIALAHVGCGVKQYNSSPAQPPPKPAPTATTPADTDLAGSLKGPNYAAGKSQGAMSPPSSGCGSGARPCVKARVNLGLPYQYDSSSNTTKGYTTQAGAGVSAPPPGSMNSGQLRNRDLQALKRQAGSGEQSF